SCLEFRRLLFSALAVLAAKFAAADARERDFVVAPLVGRMGKPRLRGKPGERRAMLVARNDVEDGRAARGAHEPAADLPVPRVLAPGARHLLLEHLPGLVRARRLDTAEGRGRRLDHHAVDREHDAEEGDEPDQYGAAGEFTRCLLCHGGYSLRAEEMVAHLRDLTAVDVDQ